MPHTTREKQRKKQFPLNSVSFPFSFCLSPPSLSELPLSNICLNFHKLNWVCVSTWDRPLPKNSFIHFAFLSNISSLSKMKFPLFCLSFLYTYSFGSVFFSCLQVFVVYCRSHKSHSLWLSTSLLPLLLWTHTHTHTRAECKRLHNPLIHEFVHFIYNSQLVQAFDCICTQVSRATAECDRDRKHSHLFDLFDKQ